MKNNTCISSPSNGMLVSDGQYAKVLSSIISKSTQKCLCSIFIIDLINGGNSSNNVFNIIELLEESKWRGVDTRIIIGGSRSNFDIAAISETSRKILSSLSIPCKWLTSMDKRGSHAKLVICDDYVLLGSHNWSAGAFTNQIQDSILLQSKPLAAFYSEYFNKQWTN